MSLADRIRANIRHLIEARGYTYSDLGWPRQYVYHVLSGERGLSLERVEEFARRLRVDPAELFRGPSE
jgi:antitoxin component HigA of HigAB toxin-antitoxin module